MSDDRTTAVPGDELPAHIDHLFNKPQNSWSVAQWRAFAEFQSQELTAARAAHASAVALAAASAALAKRWMASHQAQLQALAVIEVALKRGLLIGKINGRRPGRPKKLSPEHEAYLDEAMVELVRRGLRPSVVARKIAVHQLRKEGLKNPEIHPSRLAPRQKTLANRYAGALRRVTQQALSRHGSSTPEATDELEQLGP